MAQTITQPIDRQVRSGPPLCRRDGLLCALLLAACLLLAHPFVEMGFIDDWSFIKTAQVFAQTGHWAYNGWGAVALGWQALWGALFSKLLGFSFVHVRLSMLPIAMASVYVFHQILMRFGLLRGYALFGTLTLALSPVFMAMSASFMTDVPGLFGTLVCLYLCQRALSAPTDATALAWLALATVTGVVGGTARQTTWLGVLLIVPSTVWLLRRRRLLWRGALLWLAGVASVFVCLHWFNHQPYFVHENLLPEGFTLIALERTTTKAIKAFLCLLLLVFPVLVAWWPLARSVPRHPLLWLSVISSVVLAGLLVYWGRHDKLDSWTAPWLAPIMGLMGTGAIGDIPGPKPFTLHYWQRIIITVLVLGAALLFFLHLCSRLRRRAHNERTAAPSWHQLFWLLGPYMLGYLGALIIQGVAHAIFDRYLLTLQAVGLIFLLRYYQDFAAPEGPPRPSPFTVGRLPAVSQLALLAFAYYAIAGTHDLFALSRARLEAAEEVRRSGVPRTAIQAGFEYDAWTQLEAGGYINEPRIRIPQGAFHPVPLSPELPLECSTWFSRIHFLTPTVIPQYFVVFAPLPCFASSPFPAVTYHAWMPPFTRQVYVQQRKD